MRLEKCSGVSSENENLKKLAPIALEGSGPEFLESFYWMLSLSLELEDLPANFLRPCPMTKGSRDERLLDLFGEKNRKSLSSPLEKASENFPDES
jgi:hypothetical protein